MNERNRGLNRKGFAPELQEAMNLFNQDMNDLKWFPEIEILQAQEQCRLLTSDEKKDTLFVKRMCREYARTIFKALNELYNKRLENPDETFPMYSWNMVIAYDNAIYRFRTTQADGTHIYPLVWELNSELAMVMVIRSLARANLLYFTSKNFDSARIDFRSHLKDVIMDIDKYEFVPARF